MFWGYVGHVLGFSWVCFGELSDMFRRCVGNVLGLFCVFLGCSGYFVVVLDVFMFVLDVPELFWMFLCRFCPHVSWRCGRQLRSSLK